MPLRDAEGPIGWAQHVVSTMRLVDDADEQLMLEQLLADIPEGKISNSLISLKKA